MAECYDFEHFMNSQTPRLHALGYLPQCTEDEPPWFFRQAGCNVFETVLFESVGIYNMVTYCRLDGRGKMLEMERAFFGFDGALVARNQTRN